MVAVAVLFVIVGVGLAAACWHLQRQLVAERRQAQLTLAEREAMVREQATADERMRIFADLHDDLGARLLGMVHAAATPAEADRARELLQNLRDVVSRSRGTPGTLADVLAEIQSETRQRLAGAGIGLSWHCPDELPDPELDAGRALHLYRIVREAISNVIRHAQARAVRVRVAAGRDRLMLELTDDGLGAGEVGQGHGLGVHSMRERAAELAGDIDWRAGTVGGTKVVLSVPLEPAP